MDLTDRLLPLAIGWQVANEEVGTFIICGRSPRALMNGTTEESS